VADGGRVFSARTLVDGGAVTDYLTCAERAQLDELRHRDPFVRETLRQVERIVSSRGFDRVQQRPKDFLAYVVAKTLLGCADQIKETTIALSVFGESADFNPAETAKVRVAAGDLRQRLLTYAKQEGKADIIQILIPLNTYVPDIRDRRVTVAITEFENWHPHGDQHYLCAAITAEIAYRLCQAGLRAGPAEILKIGICRRRFTLRGSVESLEHLIRINWSLADPASGRILCSRNVEGSRDDVLRLTRDVTEALLKSLVPTLRRSVHGPRSLEGPLLAPVPRRKRHCQAGAIHESAKSISSGRSVKNIPGRG
jgi:TolB-like protein